jgi:hypothetical protein
MVCFSSAQLCGQGAERIRANYFIGFFCTEAGCPNQSGPPVALRCGGDRLIFCGELGDRSPGLLFDSDRFMRREFGADVLENAAENTAAGDFIVLSRMRTPSVCGASSHTQGLRKPSPHSTVRSRSPPGRVRRRLTDGELLVPFWSPYPQGEHHPGFRCSQAHLAQSVRGTRGGPAKNRSEKQRSPDENGFSSGLFCRADRI